MSLKEKANWFLNKTHTKKRWPYVVLFFGWLFILVNVSTVLILGLTGFGVAMMNWAPYGQECVVTYKSFGTICTGIDNCIENDTAILGIDTTGDWKPEKEYVVNKTEWYAYRDPGYCPPPEWVISIVTWMFNFDAIMLIVGSAIVPSLMMIRIIVWGRDWYLARRTPSEQEKTA